MNVIREVNYSDRENRITGKADVEKTGGCCHGTYLGLCNRKRVANGYPQFMRKVGR